MPEIAAESLIREFADRFAGTDCLVRPLAGDASTRRYFRVRSGGSSYIVCSDPGPGSGMGRFITVHELLSAHGIPVPAVLAHEGVAGLMLLEDLGDFHLENFIVSAGHEDVESMYRSIIDILIDIQCIKPRTGVPFDLSFDVERLMFEFDFFIEHCLRGYFRADMRDGDLRELREGYSAISESLFRPELFVLAHRDFHARNIILKDGSPRLIDFQDARLGLPQYDLVSLLGDPYAGLGDDLRRDLRKYYRERALDAGIITHDAEAFDRYYDIMAFQRNIKAMGTYGFMVTVRKKMNFLPNIRWSLDFIDIYAPGRSETASVWKLIRSMLS
jgi:aminoglycoside/choline kinase family phosphotransferase